MYSVIEAAHISFSLLSRSVELMRHRETGQTVAIKMIERESLDEEMKAKVLVERDILTFADNPFIVPMYCAFETKTHMCMVMENAGGKDVALD